MIRSSVNREYLLDHGVICLHAHVYSDTVKKNEELQAEVDEYFDELRARFKKAGRLFQPKWNRETQAVGNVEEFPSDADSS